MTPFLPYSDMIVGVFAFIGALAGAILSYRSATGIARRTLLVETVTKERAQWRSDLRRVVGELVEETHAALRETNGVRLPEIHRLCTELRLRLNPRRSDEHKIDYELSDGLRSLEASLERNEVMRAKACLRLVEEKARVLLKQEWEKSKVEALSGRLTKA